MAKPTEVVIPESSIYEAKDSKMSTYHTKGMFFDYNWNTKELSYEGFRGTDKLVLCDEHLDIFSRKYSRNYTYLQFGVNEETHELTLRLV